MPPLADVALEQISEAVIEAALSQPAKVVAQRTGLTERGIRAIREREHAPSMETVTRFGFVYPSVGQVWAHWASRMTQLDLFDSHETQRQFHRDYARAGRSSDG